MLAEREKMRRSEVDGRIFGPLALKPPKKIKRGVRCAARWRCLTEDADPQWGFGGSGTAGAAVGEMAPHAPPSWRLFSLASIFIRTPLTEQHSENEVHSLGAALRPALLLLVEACTYVASTESPLSARMFRCQHTDTPESVTPSRPCRRGSCPKTPSAPAKLDIIRRSTIGRSSWFQHSRTKTGRKTTSVFILILLNLPERKGEKQSRTPFRPSRKHPVPRLGLKCGRIGALHAAIVSSTNAKAWYSCCGFWRWPRLWPANQLAAVRRPRGLPRNDLP